MVSGVQSWASLGPPGFHPGPPRFNPGPPGFNPRPLEWSPGFNPGPPLGLGGLGGHDWEDRAGCAADEKNCTSLPTKRANPQTDPLLFVLCPVHRLSSSFHSRAARIPRSATADNTAHPSARRPKDATRIPRSATAEHKTNPSARRTRREYREVRQNTNRNVRRDATRATRIPRRATIKQSRRDLSPVELRPRQGVSVNGIITDHNGS